MYEHRYNTRKSSQAGLCAVSVTCISGCLGETPAFPALAWPCVGPSLPWEGQEFSRGREARLCCPGQEPAREVLRQRAHVRCHPVQVSCGVASHPLRSSRLCLCEQAEIIRGFRTSLSLLFPRRRWSSCGVFAAQALQWPVAGVLSVIMLKRKEKPHGHRSHII